MTNPKHIKRHIKNWENNAHFRNDELAIVPFGELSILIVADDGEVLMPQSSISILFHMMEESEGKADKARQTIREILEEHQRQGGDDPQIEPARHMPIVMP